MSRLDDKLASIRNGTYTRADFIIADAKDGDMGPSLTSTGPARDSDGNYSRHRTRDEFLGEIRLIIEQDVVDIMLASVSNIERLRETGAFRGSGVTPAIRANDATDIWVCRGASYARQPSRGYRTADLDLARTATGASLGLYSITFNNDLDADIASLHEFATFRRDARRHGWRYFLEVFNPNVDCRIDPALVPHYINDVILRSLAGLTRAERPEFLKIAYNGPKALEELASCDSSLIVGVLGGGAGTARDCFELLHQAEKYGARVALFGRKINLAESPRDMVAAMRHVADGSLAPEEAVRVYHDALGKLGRRPLRPLEDDLLLTETVLQAG
ncbi:hypothetical protein [Lichenicoccus roseus]|uniref:Fructose-bisphosphate aldolase n=1 Tax=Lichenicoccus roseus TaxID=2683649 RepID=A0A5R9J920_9PROT|nr:hypothetical protein [Lichenicoccus roseus]TLU73047.1 hypothetical protein FE263_06305 [Lichenicoccus roseus]